MSESGKTIGRFEVTTELGRGSMGIVSRAHDPVMGRDVAIKTFLLPNGLDDHDRKRYMERFLREARAAGRLSHPGIVTIYDFHEGPDDSAPFIAMEYIEGPTLHETIVREGAQDPEWVLAMGESLADALHLAHREGVVHRDLKPANILIRKSDRVAKIADFGIARINAADQTEAGVTVGSPAYMSPERLRGERADARSDLFSLGVILYEAVTGRSPFDAEVFEVTCYSILNEPPPPSLDANWDRFFERALAKDRMARFQTGAEFRDAVIALRDQQLSRTLDRLETSLDTRRSLHCPLRLRPRPFG